MHLYSTFYKYKTYLTPTKLTKKYFLYRGYHQWGGGRGKASYCLMATKFLYGMMKKFGKWIVMMVE